MEDNNEKKPEEEKKAEEDSEKKPEEEKKAEDEKPKEEEKKADDKEEDKEKATSVTDALKSIVTAIEKLDGRIAEQGKKIKAMETPTDLPLKPKLSDKEDIGADTKAPDTYQSNSQQASIDDADPKNSNETDPAKLNMQEKAKLTPVEKAVTYTTTTTPRSPYVDIQKSIDSEKPNPILAMAREVGHDEINKVANAIRQGKFYTPTAREVSLY